MNLTAERWQLAKEIVADALDEKSLEERTALMARRCAGDPLLRREVESLLAQTTAVFEECADDAPTRRDLPALETGRRIGAYAIVSEIGRGGMGAVYLAQRADGAFDKKVAIKVLKRGLDTDEILRRFFAERQILARLDHPSIVRLIDAGTADDGLPYLAMDYVEGMPITQFAREGQLPVRERLQLFRTVCSAVTYAHQNLIVHRDLKPSNILITKEGDVRLLDFGIAKLLEPDSQAPVVTITTLRVMTPEYASPEQVKGEVVTTVSDVYSLGVVLYELLTGERPYQLSRGSTDELNKAICEQEPERPSTTVSKGDGSSKDQAPNSKLIRGDLDNIVLKALRKEPPRRYASVDQFSDDIRRHLEGLPVRARRDTFSYRAGKFLQRHKLPVAAAVLLVLALLAGVVAASWEAHRALLAEAKAQERFSQVRQLAHSVLFDYHDEIAALPGSTKVRARLVKDALTYLDNLSKDAENDASLMRELANAYAKVAAVQGGAATSHQSLLSMSNLGDTKGGLETALKAIAIRERVSQLQPDNLEVQEELAGSYAGAAYAYQLLGSPDKSVEYNRRAIHLCEKLISGQPNNESLQSQLASNYIGMSKSLGNPGVPNLGDKQGAREYKNKAQVIAENLATEHPANPDYLLLLASLHNMAVLMSDNDKEGVEESSKAIAIYEKLVNDYPENATYRRQLAVELGNIAGSMLKLGDKRGAFEKVNQAQAIYDALIQSDPNDASIRGMAALNLRKLGSAQGAHLVITPPHSLLFRERSRPLPSW